MLTTTVMVLSLLCSVVHSQQTLEDVLDPTTMQQIGSAYQFTEGPLWRSDANTLIFSDIPANTIFEISNSSSTVYKNPSGNSNGLVFDATGALFACEHGGRRISKTVGGNTESLASTWEGKSLNSPNDLCIRSADGSIYFTDPPYGINPNQQELAFNGVFRISSTGDLSLMADDFNRPNGIAFSPDGSLLYIADTQENHVRVFDVGTDGSISNSRLFIQNVQGPDGIKTDIQGNLYVTSGGGLEVYTPNGALIGILPSPATRNPSNVCFGDEDFKGIYITAGSGVFRVQGLIAGNPTNGDATVPSSSISEPTTSSSISETTASSSSDGLPASSNQESNGSGRAGQLTSAIVSIMLALGYFAVCM